MKNVFGLFLVLLLVLCLNGCDEWDDWFGDDDDDTETTSTATTDTTSDSTSATTTDTTNDSTSATTTDNTQSKAKNLRYSHYNPAAWHGAGSAIVLCTDSPTMDSCKIGGKALIQHGSRDKGRLVYTHYTKKGLSGTITCSKGSKRYSTKVSGSGLQWGSCK